MSASDSGSVASSQSSYSTGGAGSVISDSNSDAGALAKLGDSEQDASIQDLLQANKGLWDAAFSCLLLLTKNRAVQGYRMLVFRVVFEFLQIFRLVFNTRFMWVIHKDIWIWKAFYWVLFRFLVWDMGYGNYVTGVYVICSVVLALAVTTIVIAVVLRKDDTANVWLGRVVYILQNGALLVFSICWVAVLDYLVFMFTCSWGINNKHIHWHDTDCADMPHLASMVFAGVTAIVTIIVVACLAMAECSGNLVSNNLMASPVAETALKTTVLKVVMVVVSTCLDEFPKPQAVLMFICPCLSAYLQICSSPYLLPWMNHLWTGLWTGLVYTTGLLLTLNYYRPEEPWDYEVPDIELEYRESMTWAVLYGIFPCVLLGMGINWLVHRWKCKPIAFFEKALQKSAEGSIHLESITVLKSIYRFHSPDQVAFLARCVRRFDPITELVLPEAAALCSLIIQAGLARFPNNPTILLVYANYVIHVKKEPRAARQQLQLAGKCDPDVIERYNLFAANDVLKRNRNADNEAGLDLMAYVEFQRNYRACVKAHKLALVAQRSFWRSLMRDSLQLSDMLASCKSMEAAEQTAIYVYKRVLERYPQNGKLLKAWGRFQEWVLHDPARASRSYVEAVKRGVGENTLNLTSDDAGADTTSSGIDEKLDGVVIIDALGTILMVNKVAHKMFGYLRGELDGKNVSVLMPQPFSARHDSYLHNYLTTGVAKILNTERAVVAVTKDRAVFPLSLKVRRLSGTGSESVFMGVMRVPQEEDTSVVRLWCTPGGTMVCCDAKLGEWCGATSSELCGQQVGILAEQPRVIDSFVRDACGPSKAAAAAGTLKLQTTFHHKFLKTIAVEATTAFAGTDNEPLLVLRIRSIIETEPVMVVDERMRIVYASANLAKLLCASGTSLTELSLPALIPPPAAQLHKQWIADMGSTRPTGGSCRAGSVVSMVALNGARIPVRLDIRTIEQATNDSVQCLHIVKVHRATESEQQDGDRLNLIVDQHGLVLTASDSPKGLFGFTPAKDLVGQPLAAFINVFEAFRTRIQQQRLGNSNGSGSGRGRGASSSFGTNAQPPSAGNQQFSQLALQIGPGPEQAGSSEAEAALDDSMLLALLAQAAQDGSEVSYRVGVRPWVLPADQIGRAQEQSSTGGKGSLLAALTDHSAAKIRPALMRVDIIEIDYTQEGADFRDVKFQVQLWHAESLRGALEVDTSLRVCKADAAVAWMLGVQPNDVNRKLLSRLLPLPAHIKQSVDLLRAHGQGAHKASALKKTHHAAKEARVGPVLLINTVHADGQPLRLQLQAVAKEGQASKLLLHVRLPHEASNGNLQALLQLCSGGSPSSRQPAKQLAAAACPAGGAGAASRKQRGHGGFEEAEATAGLRSGSRESSGAGPQAGRGKPLGARSVREPAAVLQAASGRHSGQAALVAAPGRGLRFAGSGGDDDDEQADWQQPGRLQHGQGPNSSSRHARGVQLENSEAEAEGSEDGWDKDELQESARQQPGSVPWEHLRTPVQSGAGGRSSALQFSMPGAEPGRGGLQPDEDYGGGFDVQQAGAIIPRGSMEPGADDAASDGGSSEDGTKLDVGSASEAGDGDDADEDVTCDWRRAKRLRKILRQLDSPIARAPLLRFWRGTWGVASVLLVAHIVCYAVLSAVVTQRHVDVYGVQQLANAVDKSQMILLRANFLSKCNFPENQGLAVCSPAQRAIYLSKSISNVAAMQTYHEGVFLGTDPTQTVKLTDQTLLDWWMLPKQTEQIFYDTNPPSNTTAPISLWNLGNRFIAAAQEVNYAAKVLKVGGEQMEQMRFWQYVVKNGKDTLFSGYAASLDLYVLFCWSQLGGLSGLITGLLVAELVAVAIAAMAFQLDLVRRVCKQRMACFSVFLAMPSATIRTMAVAPCRVDEDDDNEDEEEDDLELLAGGQTETDAGASVKVNKSVRMAVTDAAEPAAGKPSSKAGKLLGRSGKKAELHGVLGWLAKQYRVARHAARGMLNRVVKVNGKRLHPARGAFASFMLPLLAWWLVAIVIFGISFTKISMLQEPLTSMQAAAHVQFNIARTRMLANMVGFLPDPEATPERLELLHLLSEELADLKAEYFTMLYGGPLRVAVKDAPPVVATAALFRDASMADLFFKTDNCLRADKSTCWGPGSPWYDVSHSGIDAMVQRLLQDVTAFTKLPPANQTVASPHYEYTWRVAANDLYEGLARVSDVFVGTTLTALDELDLLHTYLLIASIVVFVGLVLLVLVPFKKRLVTESVRLAGLLSQLPQESDVEGQVKMLVLDQASGHKASDTTNKNWSLARGVTAAAAAAARAAASRAAGAVGNIKARMAEASAANAAAQAAAGEQAWQVYEGMGAGGSEDGGSSAPDDDWR